MKKWLFVVLAALCFANPAYATKIKDEVVKGDLYVYDDAIVSGDVTVSGALVSATFSPTGNVAVGGTLTTTGATALNGGITCDTNKFIVADTSGNTTTAGTLTVTGATALNGGIACDTNKFTVADTTGNTAIAGTLGVTSHFTADGRIDLGTVETFTDSDATPDVSTGAYFKTNTTPVTITDFDGTGISDGQIIVVVSKGAVTYDVTSSGIKGGSTDIITAAGDVTTFLYDGTDWLVVARMDMSDDLN